MTAKATSYREMRLRALRLEAASKLGQRITAILEPDRLLAEVVRQIREEFGYHHVGLFLRQVDKLVLRECSGESADRLKAEGLRLDVGDSSIVAGAARAGQAVGCNDVHCESFCDRRSTLPTTRSQMAVPLHIGDEVIGVLDIQSERSHALHAEDAIPLQALGRQVAVAITNARLFRETREQFEVMRALHEISVDITSRLEVAQVISAIVKHACRLLHAEGSGLCVYDHQMDVIDFIAHYNLPRAELYRPRLGVGAVGRAIASGQPMIVNDYQHWEGSSPIAQPYIDALLVVPMYWQDQVIGALAVSDRGERRPFTDQDARLLSLLTNLASAALNNAQLYLGVVHLTQELEDKVSERTIELDRAREDLQRLLAATVQIQEEERARIARDLHDGFNQLIAGTLYEIQAAAKMIGGRQDEPAVDKLRTAEDMLRQLEAETRRIIAGVRPMALDTHGLVAALQKQAQNYWNSHQLRCSLLLSGQPVRVAQEVETAVYRIVQESLNNAQAHSHCRNVQIRLEFRSDLLQVVVDDDGLGFELDMVRDLPGRHVGLLGMRERARNIGGRLEVRSTSGRGTQIVLEVPLSRRCLTERPELS